MGVRSSSIDILRVIVVGGGGDGDKSSVQAIHTQILLDLCFAMLAANEITIFYRKYKTIQLFIFVRPGMPSVAIIGVERTCIVHGLLGLYVYRIEY